MERESKDRQQESQQNLTAGGNYDDEPPHLIISLQSSSFSPFSSSVIQVASVARNKTHAHLHLTLLEFVVRDDQEDPMIVQTNGRIVSKCGRASYARRASSTRSLFP